MLLVALPCEAAGNVLLVALPCEDADKKLLAALPCEDAGNSARQGPAAGSDAGMVSLAICSLSSGALEVSLDAGPFG